MAADDNGSHPDEDVVHPERLRVCDVWGEVDFGKGPVMVRCTQSEPLHLDHACVVFMTQD